MLSLIAEGYTLTDYVVSYVVLLEKYRKALSLVANGQAVILDCGQSLQLRTVTGRFITEL